MIILDKPIKKADLLNCQTKFEDDLVKGVVDIEQQLLAIDSGLHADLEKCLLENGSQQYALWGINLYPHEDDEEDFIEFDSMINIRPEQNNRSRSVENPEIQKEIIKTIKLWIK